MSGAATLIVELPLPDRRGSGVSLEATTGDRPYDAH